MLRELIQKRGNIDNYREFRNFVKNIANHQLGWSGLKKELGFKNFQRKFFNVVSVSLPSELLKKGETEKYIYYDIKSKRAYKDGIQLKLSKNLDLSKVSYEYPVAVFIRKELVCRYTKASCLIDPHFYIGETLQIQIIPQNVPFIPERAKKLVVDLYDEKSTQAGSYRSFSVENEQDAIFVHHFYNRSYGGTHWEHGIVLVVPIDKEIKATYIWHGAKRLMKKEEIIL